MKKLIFATISFVLTISSFVFGVIALKNNWDSNIKYFLFIASAVFLLISLILVIPHIKEKLNIKLTEKKMVIISSQAAISIILYYFIKFRLPFFPPWLEIQISEIPALITSFMYGPFSGVVVLIIRFIVKLPGSVTVGVGEFCDLVISTVLVVVSGLIYKHHRTFKGAIFGLTISVLLSTFTAMLLNAHVLIPAYISLAGFSYEALTEMLSYMNGITVDNFMLYYCFFGVLPFNIIRYTIVMGITLITYKGLHLLISKIDN